jgi:O-antigen/teichoic acid export membrane protein
VVALVWGGVVGAFACVVTLYGLPLLRSDWVFDPMLVVPFCAAVPLLLLSSYSNSIQLATEHVQGYGLQHLLTSVLFLPMFFVCFGWFGGEALEGDVPLGVAWGRLLTTVVIALVSLWMVRRIVRLRFRLNRDFLADNLRYGWKANITSTLTYLNHRVDLLVLAAVFTVAGLTGQAEKDAISQEVAFYSMAVTWAELVWHFPEAMRDLFFSKVAGSSDKQAREMTPVLARLSLLASVVGGSAMLLLVNPVMGAITWVADRFQGGAKANAWYETWSTPVNQAVLLLVPGTVAFTVSKILQADLAARNRLRVCVNAQFLVLGVMLLLDLRWIPGMGASGAALASTVAYVASTVYTLFAYTRDTGVRPWTCLVMHRSDWQYLREIVVAVARKLRLAGNGRP